MEIHLQVRRRHLVVLAALAAAVIGGVAYAALPGAGGVLTACQLNSNGSLRLIDPSLSSGPLSRCTPNETQVQWNAQGQPGAPGANGKDGTSPTVAQLAVGDSHCPAGGASITDAAGNVAYACSGAAGQPGRPGKDGAPFDGTFTSPNGQFRLTVADGGVTIIGPDSSLSLPSAGGIVIHGGNIETVANDVSTTIGHDRTESVGGNESITVSGDRTETVHAGETIKVDQNRHVTVGGDDLIHVAGGRNDRVDGLLIVRGSAGVDVAGATVSLNGMANCKPAARVGDQVSSTAILTGSATVCIGG